MVKSEFNAGAIQTGRTGYTKTKKAGNEGAKINTSDSFVQEKQEELKLIPGKMMDSCKAKALPRKMTEGEQKMFKGWFPNLKVENTVVSGESNYRYNCISWTVGETQRWFWPPSMYPGVSGEEAFDKFYASYGLKPAPEGGKTGDVARWRNDRELTHGCVSGEGHGPNWESKCGSSLRIQHTLPELEGQVYGWADKFYVRETEPPPAQEPAPVPEKVKKAAAEAAEKVDPKVKSEFDKNYSQWVQFRNNPKLRKESDPEKFCKTEGFDNIVKLGRKAMPLVLNKMAEGDFFCLQAVKKIKAREPKLFTLAPDRLSLKPEELKTSEQDKAAIMLKKYFD